MTNGISEEVLDRLEAEAKVSDADAEELTLAVESDIEETEERVEELQAEVEEKEAEVEELQKQLQSKDEEIEEMQEEVEAVKEDYAEELAAASEVMDKDDYLTKFEFEELREKASDLEDTSGQEASPSSGDPGAGFQSAGGEDGESGESEELSEKEELAAESFRQRAKKTGKQYWADIAEEIENGGE